MAQLHGIMAPSDYSIVFKHITVYFIRFINNVRWPRNATHIKLQINVGPVPTYYAAVHIELHNYITTGYDIWNKRKNEISVTSAIGNVNINLWFSMLFFLV